MKPTLESHCCRDVLSDAAMKFQQSDMGGGIREAGG